MVASSRQLVRLRYQRCELMRPARPGCASVAPAIHDGNLGPSALGDAGAKFPVGPLAVLSLRCREGVRVKLITPPLI
jgi:hypothetical protein